MSFFFRNFASLCVWRKKNVFVRREKERKKTSQGWMSGKKKEILMGKVIKISRVSLHSNSDRYLRDETYRAASSISVSNCCRVFELWSRCEHTALRQKKSWVKLLVDRLLDIRLVNVTDFNCRDSTLTTRPIQLRKETLNARFERTRALPSRYPLIYARLAGKLTAKGTL